MRITPPAPDNIPSTITLPSNESGVNRSNAVTVSEEASCTAPGQMDLAPSMEVRGEAHIHSAFAARIELVAHI